MAKSQPEKRTDVVDDFLYVDRARLAAYRTQLLGSGTPLQSKLIKNYQKSEEAAGKATVPPLFSGNFTANKLDSEGKEFTFDLGWLTALQTIDELEERGYITTNVSGVRVGSIMKLHGSLQIVDMSILHHAWPLIEAEMTKASGLNDNEQEIIRKLINDVPQPMFAKFFTSENAPGEEVKIGAKSALQWGLLDPTNFIGSTNILMNGGVFTGEYQMISVLDVGAKLNPPNVRDILTDVNTQNELLIIQTKMRSLFGRPDGANGVTPLVISRKLVQTA